MISPKRALTIYLITGSGLMVAREASATPVCNFSTKSCTAAVSEASDVIEYLAGRADSNFTDGDSADGDNTILCGWTLTIDDGVLDSTLTIDIDTSVCSTTEFITIQANASCLDAISSSTQLGASTNNCDFDTEDESMSTSAFTAALDADDTYTYIKTIKIGDSGGSVSSMKNVVIKGFASNLIKAGGEPCNNCRIYQNYVFNNDDYCLWMKECDDIEIVGNRMFACGHAEGDISLVTDGSAQSNIHQNDIVGTGYDNYEYDASTPTDRPAPQGSDAWTLDRTSGEDSCGTEFHHNRVLSHGFADPEPENAYCHRDDGNGIDIKKQTCKDDPIRIYSNLIDANHGDNILIHKGATGVYIYNNQIKNSWNGGVRLETGYECKGGSEDFGYLSDIYIHGNLIESNGDDGVLLYDNGDIEGTCTASYTEADRDAVNIHIFNNAFVNNGDGYKWSNPSSDEDCPDALDEEEDFYTSPSTGSAFREYEIYLHGITDSEKKLEDGEAYVYAPNTALTSKNVTVVNNMLIDDDPVVISSTDYDLAMRLETVAYATDSASVTYAYNNGLTSPTYASSWYGWGNNSCDTSSTTCTDGNDGILWTTFLPGNVLNSGSALDDLSLIDINGTTWDFDGSGTADIRIGYSVAASAP